MKSIKWIIGVCLFLMVSFQIHAQTKQRKVVQFSGIVVSGDSAYGVPGVYIYVQKEGRGTMSNALGYFSMPTLTGDTITVKSIGYKEKSFVVPHVENDKVSVIIEIYEDTMFMPMVEITPWPTERLFKEAFVSLQLPTQDLDNMNSNLNEQVLRRIMYAQGADGSLNHSYYMQQKAIHQHNQYYAPTLSLTNPFAWKKFIDDVKKGDLKTTKPAVDKPLDE